MVHFHLTYVDALLQKVEIFGNELTYLDPIPSPSPCLNWSKLYFLYVKSTQAPHIRDICLKYMKVHSRIFWSFWHLPMRDKCAKGCLTCRGHVPEIRQVGPNRS